MELELKLHESEEVAKKVRRASLDWRRDHGGVLDRDFAARVLSAGGDPLGSSELRDSGEPRSATTGVLLTLYWHKYRPAIDRQRADLRR